MSDELHSELSRLQLRLEKAMISATKTGSTWIRVFRRFLRFCQERRKPEFPILKEPWKEHAGKNYSFIPTT
jgi:hypothetical protein